MYEKHVNRMIHGFVYGNRGRKPAHVITEETKQNILDFLSYKISGCYGYIGETSPEIEWASGSDTMEV